MNKKKLQEIYNKAKGEHAYYSFEEFCNDAKNFLKDIKKRNLVMSMTVSRSGMTRHFNSLSYNEFLNVCYNGKFDNSLVRVTGCGMDMHWNLLFQTCELILGMYDSNAIPETREKWLKLNTLCSHQPLL